MLRNEPSPRLDNDKYRELRLQRIDAAALRKLAGENNEINWSLQVDEIYPELEMLLMKLGESLKNWFFQLQCVDDEHGDLAEQIAHIKNSADIEDCVAQIEQRDLKILGGTYVAWGSDRGLLNAKTKRILPIFTYRSRPVVALAIVPKAKAIQPWRDPNFGELAGLCVDLGMPVPVSRILISTLSPRFLVAAVRVGS